MKSLTFFILVSLMLSPCVDAVVGKVRPAEPGQEQRIEGTEMHFPMTGHLSIKQDQSPESLTLILTVTNTSAQELRIHFSSGMGADLLLKDSRRKLVWAWSREMMFTQALRQLSLMPGKSMTFSFALPQDKLSECSAPCVVEAIFVGKTASGEPLMAPVIKTLNALVTARAGQGQQG